MVFDINQTIRSKMLNMISLTKFDLIIRGINLKERKIKNIFLTLLEIIMF